MSNVKLLIVGDADVGLKYTPQGIWAANKMRLDGHGHGEARSFPFGDVLLRVILDDYAGDKCYIHTETSCPSIEYSGFLDTFPSLQSYPTGQPLRAQELQEDIEDLPRERNGEWIEGAPKMYGIRKFPAYDSSSDPVPTLPPGYTLESTTYPKVSVPRQEQDDDFREFFNEHKPTRYTGLMRRVLQCTFGTRTWADALTFRTAPEAPRQFVVNYKFGDSWGVILAPGKDGSLGSHYFLIWITSGEVFWVPASFCVHKVKVGATDTYAPILKLVQRTGAISLGTLPPLGGSSCSQAIGWAFSYVSPKASVVIYGESAPYYTTRLVGLSVDFEEAIPIGVTLDIGQSQILWNPLRQDKAATVVTPVGLLNLPTEDGARIVTLDIRNGTSTPPYDYDVVGVPVYTYYLPGALNPEIVTYDYRPQQAQYESYAAPTSAEEAFARFAGSKSVGYSVQWGFSLREAPPMTSRGSETSSYTEYYLLDSMGFCMPSDGGAPYAPYNHHSRFSVRYKIRATEMGHGWDVQQTINNLSGASDDMAMQKPLRLHPVLKSTNTKTGGAVSTLSTCTLPVDDREAVILLQSADKTAYTNTETISYQSTYAFDPGEPLIWISGASGNTVYGRAALPINRYSDNDFPAEDDYMASVYWHAATWVNANYPAYAPATIQYVYDVEPTTQTYTSGYTYPPLTYSWPFSTLYYGFAVYHYVSEASIAGGVDNVDLCQVANGGVTIPTGVLTDRSTIAEKIVAASVYSAAGSRRIDTAVWENALTKVYDTNDNWSISHGVSAFQNLCFYDKAPFRHVVCFDDKEYNVENSLYGFIGVV